MSDIETLTKKYNQIQESIKKASDLRSRLDERKASAEKRLKALVEKIAAQGYDIKNLKEIRDKKEAELKTLLAEKEKEVTEVLGKLQSIDLDTAL